MGEKEGRPTNPTLAVRLVDAEHRNVSPEVPFTVGRLFTDNDPNRKRDTFGVSLRNEREHSISGLTADCYSYKERQVRPRGGKDGRVSCGQCRVNEVKRGQTIGEGSNDRCRRRRALTAHSRRER